MWFRKAFIRCSPVSFEVKECDGASGNDRLTAHWVRQEHAASHQQPMLQTMLCRNHLNHLVFTHTASTVGKHLGDKLSLVGDCFAAPLFFQDGWAFHAFGLSCKVRRLQGIPDATWHAAAVGDGEESGATGLQYMLQKHQLKGYPEAQPRDTPICSRAGVFSGSIST